MRLLGRVRMLNPGHDANYRVATVLYYVLYYIFSSKETFLRTAVKPCPFYQSLEDIPTKWAMMFTPKWLIILLCHAHIIMQRSPTARRCDVPLSSIPTSLH